MKNDLLALGRVFQTAEPPPKSKRKRVRSDSTFRGSDWRQNKAKLKQGSRGLNLLRLVELAAFFMVSNLLTSCRAACPSSATVPTESSAISTISGATSHVLSNRGYSLTKSKIWKTTSLEDDSTVNGIEFTYSSDYCGFPDIVHMYGSSAAYVWSVSIA